MTYPSHEIWGVKLHDLSDGELRNWIRSALQENKPQLVVTPNPEFLLAARKQADYRNLLNAADLSLPDGVGIRFAVAANGKKLNYRHAGVDVVEILADICRETASSFVLLGGMHPFLERARQYFATQFPGISCTAINPGLIPDVVDADLVSQNIVHQLTVDDAKVIAVALGRGRGAGRGKQERYIVELAQKYPQARVIIGVGGAIDYFGSMVSRAPKLWRKYGFEWLWRLGAEPWRSWRIFNAVVVFPILVAWDTLRNGKFLSACRFVAKDLISHFRG